jgi:SAM-dependent methyltransferase/methyltransferase-like protein
MDSTTARLQSDFDEFPYEELVHGKTHPERLAVVAMLGGMQPTDIEACRVLEVGCANGINIIDMAMTLPRSHFVGVDLSSRQIEDGRRIVSEVGLRNVELHAQDLSEFGRDASKPHEKFDYIIAHGFYAWVPQPVQQRLLEVIREHLTPNGVAYISYNVFPGWRHLQVIREMMLFHARNTPRQADRVARGREILKLAAANSLDQPHSRDALQFTARMIASASDHYLAHDHMAAANDPKYFTDFVREIRAHGLEYIANSEPDADSWYRLSAEVTDLIVKSSADAIEREQYLDFLTGRTFRGSVICLAGAARNARELPFRKIHLAANFPEIAAGTNAQGQEVVQFGNAQTKVNVTDPRLRAVMAHLRRQWPGTAPFNELVRTFAGDATGAELENARIELAGVMKVYFDLKLVELRPRSLRFIATTPGPRPKATALARWQAANNRMISTLRHSAITLDEAGRELLPLLDGSRDVHAIATEIQRRKAAGSAKAWPHDTIEQLLTVVTGLLKLAVDSSLLVDDAEI